MGNLRSRTRPGRWGCYHPHPPQIRTCRITASGSSRGSFAPNAPGRLSIAVSWTGCGAQCPLPVSRQWFSTRDASLPSAGSRWARFPGVGSTTKALRLPAPHGPDAHGVRASAPRRSPRSCFAEALPPGWRSRAGQDCLLTRPSSLPGHSSRGRIRALPGSLAVLPMPLPSSRTPVGPALASHYARQVLPPQRRKRGLRRTERFRGLPLGFSTRCLRFRNSVARPLQDSLPAGWLAFAARASIPLNRFNRFQIISLHDLPPLQGLPWRYLAALGMTKGAP